MLQAHNLETTKEDRNLQLNIRNIDTADRRWQPVSGGEKRFPLQKPFKPDGVNRERRTRRENTRCISASSDFTISCSFIFGDSHVHTLMAPVGPTAETGGVLRFSPDNNDTLTTWKHAGFHAVKWFSSGWPSLSLWTGFLSVTEIRLPWQSNSGPVRKY